jgi:predicted HTH transcriptional regulator
MQAKDASSNDIDFEKIKRYIRKASFTGRKNISAEEKPLQILEKLGLIKKRQPTWAALLRRTETFL